VLSRTLELAAILVICFFADDIVLLAPTPSAMRTMLTLCDNFADDLHIVFNAKKSKCIHIRPELKLPYGSPEFFYWRYGY